MVQAKGYTVRLLFFWLNSPELALQRVAERVSKGGHNIPEPIVRRRYVAGISNLFRLFMNEVDLWDIYDNSQKPRIEVACGGKGVDPKRSVFWSQLFRQSLLHLTKIHTNGSTQLIDHYHSSIVSICLEIDDLRDVYSIQFIASIEIEF